MSSAETQVGPTRSQVAVGDELPVMHKNASRAELFLYSAASSNPHRIHYDRDYAEFEGRIPEGEYGGGTVIVWDIGPYRNLTTDDDGEEIPVGRAVEVGHVKVWSGRSCRAPTS